MVRSEAPDSRRATNVYVCRSNATNCGLDGDYCRPFDAGTFAFRCPAGCSSFMVLEPYFVGPQEINYQQLVIGGGTDEDETEAV